MKPAPSYDWEKFAIRFVCGLGFFGFFFLLLAFRSPKIFDVIGIGWVVSMGVLGTLAMSYWLARGGDRDR